MNKQIKNQDDKSISFFKELITIAENGKLERVFSMLVQAICKQVIFYVLIKRKK
jgi:hypothetical protein